MPNVIITKTITAPNFRLVANRVIWSFKDNQHNPVMQVRLAKEGGRAELTPAGLTLRTNLGNAWQVRFDAEGNILRRNGMPYLLDGRPVNALNPNHGERDKVYVSFWDLVFERDRAPLEGRTHVPLRNFYATLYRVLDGENLARLANFYFSKKVGPKGEFVFGEDPRHFLLWGLTLQRRYSGKLVNAFPLIWENILAIGLYDPETNEHLYTFEYDPTVDQFFHWRAKEGRIFREYFVKVPPSRTATVCGSLIVFNEKAVVGDIFVAEQRANGLLLRRGDQTKPIAAHSISSDDNTSGLMLGMLSPSSLRKVDGWLSKPIYLSWNKADNYYYFKIFGKQYYLTAEDLKALNISLTDPVFVQLEDGHVIAVRSNRAKQKIFYRVIRNQELKILYSARLRIPTNQLGPGIWIIEGLESSSHKRIATVQIKRRPLSLGRPSREVPPRTPISVVLKIDGNHHRILTWTAKPQFSPDDREQLLLMFSNEDLLALSLWECRSAGKRTRVRQFVFNAIDHNHSLRKFLEAIQTFIEDPATSALDIVYLLNMLYDPLGQFRRTTSSNLLAEAFIRMPQILQTVNHNGKAKIAEVYRHLESTQGMNLLLAALNQNSMAYVNRSE